MSRVSLDLGIGLPPTGGRSRKESAARHGRSGSTAGEVLAASPGKAGSPLASLSPSSPPIKASSPPKALFAIPDAMSSLSDDPFAIFDPLAAKPSNPPLRLSVGQKPPLPNAPPPAHAPPTAAADSFANFFSSSSSSSSPPTRKSDADKKKPKKKEVEEEEDDSDDEEESDSEGEESEGEESEQEEGAQKKKGNTKEKASAQKPPTKADKDDEKAKAAKKSEAAAAAVASISAAHVSHRQGPPVLKVDVLQYMKKGTPFLKYGNHGYPHFRQFQLSDDNTKIVWFSQAKKLKDTQVDIADIDEIRLGQTTPNFQKHKAPELARSSFSVIYGGGRKTLDVIAKDPNEFKIWTEGLKELVRRCKSGSGGELETLKQLVLSMGVHPGRRSSVEIFDVTTGLNADNISPAVPEDPNTRPRALSSGNKQMYKDVAKNFLELKRKLNKRKEELREQEYYSHPQYENMQVIVKRVQDSINKINEWFQDGEYPLCDDEIWRASVDLESLKNMMKAVKTT